VHNLDYGNGPVRKSVMATAEFKKAYSFAPGLLKAFETGVNPRLVVPDLTIWGKVQAVMNKEIMKAATGKVSADEALATMNRLVERDLKEAGFLK
jgi:ABC-type glycerol-3-phosphate transport system substrate-binding protein